MGVFCLLKQPQREANLRIRLDEYLPDRPRGRRRLRFVIPEEGDEPR